MKRIIKAIIKALGNIKLPIVFGPLRGSWWILGSSEGDYGGVSVLINRSEREQLELVKSFVNKNDVCFDIGANVGIYSLLFSKLAKKVYSFEPVPRNVTYLYKNMYVNNVTNNEICAFAIGRMTNLALFNISSNWAQGKFGNSGSPVASVSLDDICKKIDVMPSVVKIDVEGVELDVIKGARTMITKCKPTILISFHGIRVKKDCIKLLKEFGYTSITPIVYDNSSEYIVKES